MKVNILLSTYNGATYLRDQVKSIQNQTFKDWNLLIRDDGSTDGTVGVIKELVGNDDRIRWINERSNENVGVIQSFFQLLKYEKADFYFFSDQDDVWLPEKIEKQLALAKGRQDVIPLMVYTDLKVVDENLNVMHESMIRTQSGHANTEFIQELTENTVTGGVSMINHALSELWTGEESYPLLMHDWYLALLACTFGALVYLDEPTELYRQHSNNVLGARTLTKRMRNWVRPQILFAKYWKLIKDSQNQALNLLDMNVSPYHREMIENFVTIMDVPMKERIRRIQKYGYRKNRPFHIMVFTFLIVTKFAYKEK